MRNYWKSKLSNSCSAVVLTLLPFCSLAQLEKSAIAPRNGEEYIYPVHPGRPGSLAGTMGELRSTHFHSGIDIRTNNMIGFPVVASKSGYISRVSVSPSGYGNIVYITHPDGNTTLYAHLDRFRGAVARHVLEEQYRQKNFNVDLYFKEDQFAVKQGDTIAISGNSGSSSGPHLHFDIRDKDNFALDPLKVASFPEIPDNLPPAPEKIALRTLDISSRINDRFGRFEFYASGAGRNYTIANPILAHGLVGIEIVAKDRLAPRSPFYGGVNYIDVRVDSQLVFSQAIDKIDISETRAIYTLMDFRTMRTKGTRFYKLYIDDGNNLDFYSQSPGSGKIRVPADRESVVDISLKDSYGNASNVSFRIRPSPPSEDVPLLESTTVPFTREIHENILMVSRKGCADSLATTRMWIDGKGVPIAPAYGNANKSVYLIDLRKNRPDSLTGCGATLRTNLAAAVPTGTEYRFYSETAEVTFPEGALYDTLYLESAYEVTPERELFTLGDRTIPLNKPIAVSLKPRGKYNQNLGTSVYRVTGRSLGHVGGQWINGRIEFTTREFGEFTIIEDLVPPTIRAVHADRTGFRFKIRDNLSGINTFEANINGEWLLMHYDAKTGTIWSEPLDRKRPLTGTFRLVVTDNAGNQSTFTKKVY